MPGPNPTVRLGVEMTPESRQVVSSFVSQLKDQIRDRSRTHGSDDPELKRLREMYDVVKKTAAAGEEGTIKVRRLSSELGGIGNALRNLNIVGGAGGAAAGGIMDIGGAALAGAGIGAVIAAVTAVVGMAMKMGLEFERTSTRAAQTLSIGSANFKANYDAVRSASFAAGEPYGIGVHEMAGAISAFGLTSGATGAQAGRSARGIARYARGYGLDPTQLAGMVGTLSASTGESFDTGANALFGGAEEAGPLGRRITEFIGTATNVLTSLQMGDPNKRFGAEDASSLVRNIARIGGVFGTGPGVQATVAAAGGLTAGMGSNVAKMAFAERAGITNPIDLILERTNPEIQRKMMAEAIREYGRPGSAGLAAGIVGLAGSPQAARMLFGALDGVGGNPSALFNTRSARSAPIDQRVGDYLSKPLASFDRFSAHIENTMTEWGDKINNLINGPLSSIDAALDGVGGAATRASQALGYFGAGIQNNTTSMTGAPLSYYDKSTGGADRTRLYGPGRLSSAGLVPLSSILGDLRQDWNPRNHTGTTLDLFSEVNQMLAMGYSMKMGVINTGHYTNGYNDIHKMGRAFDVDGINGVPVTNESRSPILMQFALDVVKNNPRARLLTDNQYILDYVKKSGYGAQTGRDGYPDNIHVEVAPGGNSFTGPQMGTLRSGDIIIKHGDGSQTRVATTATHTPAPPKPNTGRGSHANRNHR